MRIILKEIAMIRGFLMSLGMFSVIPVPRNSWNEKYMPLVIPALPVVGLLIGLLWYGAAWFLLRLDVPVMMTSVFLLLIPFVLTGLIHLDGFMDTADAVLSRRPLEDKKRILKDPNAGAFSVIAVILLMLLQFSAMYTIVGAVPTVSSMPVLQWNLIWGPISLHLPWLTPFSFVVIPVVSRCVTGAALILCKPVFETGYNASFKAGTKNRHLVFIFILGLLCVVLAPLAALVGVVAGVGTAVYLHRQFEGMSGDLCGCIVMVSECVALVGLGLVS